MSPPVFSKFLLILFFKKKRGFCRICPQTFQPKRTLTPGIPHNCLLCPRSRVRLHRIPVLFFFLFLFCSVSFPFRKNPTEQFFISGFQPSPRFYTKASTFAQPSSTSPHGSHRRDSFSAKRNTINSPHLTAHTAPHLTTTRCTTPPARRGTPQAPSQTSGL